MSEVKKGPVTKLKEELEKTRQEAKAHYDNYLRAVAEFDNYRKRMQKENEEFREYAYANLLLDLVPVLENFDRALFHIGLGVKNNSKANNESAKPEPSWVNGIKIIYNQMKEILLKYGFQEYSCLGEEFDPKKCEAVSFIETDEKPPNIVFEEVGKGYMFKGKVLRPSLVIVSKPKSTQASAEPERYQEGE